MDKRGASILFGCLAGTIIVVLLFLLASRLTQPSCELIVIEQSQHRSSAQVEWPKEEPIKSHDKTTLIKISAYLEYNMDGGSKQDKLSSGQNHSNLLQAGQDMFSLPASSNQQHPLQPAANPTTGQGQQMQQHQQHQQQPQQQSQLPNSQPNAQVPAQASSQQQNAGMSPSKGPIPSTPRSAFTNQHLANSSFPLNQSTLAAATSTSGSSSSDSKPERPRFLPIKLDDIEMTKTEDNKYTYTLDFKCSTMDLHFVRKLERVYIEKITLDLEPKSQNQSSCELQLPADEMFNTEVSSIDGWAHYYCDRPLEYSCYHYSVNKPALLLANLHVDGFEYETTGTAGQPQQQQPGSSSANNKPTHKKHEFLGVRGKTCTGV